MKTQSAIPVSIIMLLAAAWSAKAADPIKGFPEATLTVYPMAYTITGPIQEHREFYDGMMGPAGQQLFALQKKTVLLLAEKGYAGAVTADVRFERPEGLKPDVRATAFGEFVRKQSIQTDYALCVDVTVHLEEGIQGIYAVLVDAQGNRVWETHAGPGDADFDRAGEMSPEKCCKLVCDRLVPLMNINPQVPPALSAEQEQELRALHDSEPPNEAEFNAMAERLKTMKALGPEVRILVLPARVNGKKSGAAHLAKLLNDGELCQATAENEGPDIITEGWPNEQEVLWLFANAVKRHVQENPVEGEYQIFADYWFAPNGQVWAVHFVLCDSKGEWLIADLQNSHQADFQRVAPKTVEDCDRLVVERLKALR